MPYGPYGDHMNRWDNGGWVVMTIMMLLFLAALVVLVVWLVRTTSGPSRYEPPVTSNAEHLLAERFARGEIDEEEFTRRRALLRAGPGR